MGDGTGSTAAKRKRGRAPMPIEERFWAKVNKVGPIPAHKPELGPCWLWTGTRVQQGYGTFWLHGHNRVAHCIAYELTVGPIPDGLELDHLCRRPSCVNPAHLEAVTHQVNVLRAQGWAGINAAKERCPADHPYDEANTGHYRGWRVCKACKRELMRTKRQRERGERAGRVLHDAAA